MRAVLGQDVVVRWETMQRAPRSSAYLLVLARVFAEESGLRCPFEYLVFAGVTDRRLMHWCDMYHGLN